MEAGRNMTIKVHLSQYLRSHRWGVEKKREEGKERIQNKRYIFTLKKKSTIERSGTREGKVSAGRPQATIFRTVRSWLC